MGSPAGVRVNLILFLFVLLLVASVGYWRVSHSDKRSLVAEFMAEFQKRSVPPKGKLLDATDLKREVLSVSCSWEIEWEGTWTAYRAYLDEHFFDFKMKESADGKLLMLKQLPGDSLRLEFVKSAENPLRVRVSFVGYPS